MCYEVDSAIAEARERFISIYEEHISRKGSQDLMDWLDKSDFFIAPASKRYHLSVPGGLCIHTLHVYDRLIQLLKAIYLDGTCPFSDESVAIVALLHDICKVNLYKQSWKNQKIYDPEKVKAAPPGSVKSDSSGEFFWDRVPAYEIDERMIYGHGEKSAFIAMNFIELTVEEAQAIRYHMSSWKHDDTQDVGKVYEKNTLALLLHHADELATFIDEA